MLQREMTPVSWNTIMLMLVEKAKSSTSHHLQFKLQVVRNKNILCYRIFKYFFNLFVAGSKIYVKWQGGGFFSPPYVLLENGHCWSKNDKTILPYIFEDLTEGLEHMRPPQPPKKPTF